MASTQAARSRPVRGAELELTIESLAFGGRGVARRDGYVVFVQGAVPGDRVRARITKPKRTWAEAQTVEVVEPSPERVEPRAAHPGAPWQVLTYERQLAEKQAQVREALERHGGFEQPPLQPIEPAASPWGYRNKLEYSFGTGAGGELVLGFHRPGSFSEIEDLSRDVLASDRVDALREAVKAWCRAQDLDAYDRRDHTGFLRNLVVREGRRSGALQARLVTTPGDLDADALAAAIAPELAAGGEGSGLLWTEDASVAETTRQGSTQLVSGSDAIEEELLGLRFRISPDAFFQTNTEMAERLYAQAIELAGLRGSERVFDLYCGIGTIALSLAIRAREVVGVEVVEEAVRDAIGNARLNEIENARFFAGDIRTAMRPLIEEAGQPDVVVLDPPRAGLSAKVVRRVLEAGARRIVYVSCNPTTLAPNARQMVEGGYRLVTVRPIDMFPQTPHIESVALLERSS